MRKGLVHEWLTVNYDGLAQKAGCPQEKMIELHGSWFDPSNPKLSRNGKIRPDLQKRLEAAAECTDLALVLGTSLSSSSQTVESVAFQPAYRSLAGKSIGVVLINLQHTPLDPLTTVRLFADTDHVMLELAKLLDLPLVEPTLKVQPTTLVVPYDIDGVKAPDTKIELSFFPGSHVRLSGNHNCQASGQQSLSHISQGELLREGGRVVRRTRGEGRLVRYCSTQRAWELEVEGVKMLLGYWWLQAARRGALDFLPLVNISKHGHKTISTEEVHSKQTEEVVFVQNRKTLEPSVTIVTGVTTNSIFQ